MTVQSVIVCCGAIAIGTQAAALAVPGMRAAAVVMTRDVDACVLSQHRRGFCDAGGRNQEWGSAYRADNGLATLAALTHQSVWNFGFIAAQIRSLGPGDGMLVRVVRFERLMADARAEARQWLVLLGAGAAAGAGVDEEALARGASSVVCSAGEAHCAQQSKKHAEAVARQHALPDALSSVVDEHRATWASELGSGA